MAKVAIRVADFEDGALPPVCVSSGAPTSHRYAFHATNTPTWPVVLLFLGPFGWIAMLVVLAGTTRRVDGGLPLDPEVRSHQLTVRRTVRTIAAALACATVVSGVLLQWANAGAVAAVVILGGLLATAVAWAIAIQPPGSVRVRLDRNGRTVHLAGVSPAFVDAARRAEQARLARRDAERFELH